MKYNILMVGVLVFIFVLRYLCYQFEFESFYIVHSKLSLMLDLNKSKNYLLIQNKSRSRLSN